jgi:anion transporter
VSDEVSVQTAGDPLEALLRRVPFFRTLDRVEIARLIGALEHERVPAGSVIFPEGAQADSLYLLERGRIVVTVSTGAGERRVAVLSAPAHFGEMGLLLDRRTGAVRTLTEVDVWKLPRPRFEQLVREKPAIGIAMAASLASMVDRTSRGHLGAPDLFESQQGPVLDVPRVRRMPRARIAGAALALCVPVVLWHAAPPAGLDVRGWHMGLILLGAIIGWLLEPVPDFVVALAMAVAWGVTGLVTLAQAFAGFASATWLVCIGAFGLAAAMIRSGLPFRLALFLLRTTPATHAGQVVALLIGGFMATPLVPVGIARVATIAPLTHELAQSLGYPARSRASAALAFAGLIGYGSFGTVFLTGLAMNFFVIDLMPPEERAAVSWISWFIGALPVALTMLLGSIAVLLRLFRPELTPKAIADLLGHQRRVLGPLSPREWVTVAALIVLLGGLLLQPVLGVDTAWLALIALIVVTAGQALDREGFRGSIEWGLLVFFGVVLGAGSILQGAGLDRWLAGLLIPLAQSARGPGVLVIALAVFVVACRLVLPWIPAALLLCLALVPAAKELALSPWIVGFVVLTAAGAGLLPNQNDLYRLMRAATRDEMFTQRQGMILGVALALVTLAGIALSIPFWRAIGLLP